jgi:hypothetical protein
MNNSGLTSRLRQQSRRTGLAVGFAMALTIALCIGIFVVAYAGFDPLTRDFIEQASPTPTSEPSDTGGDTADTNAPANNQTENSSSGDNDSSNNNDNQAAPEPTNTPAPKPTSTPDEFVANYLSNTEQGVNFRSGPGTDNDVLLVLDAGTPLKSTGNEQDDDSGTAWMEFETRDGTTGWIRQIDAVPNS